MIFKVLQVPFQIQNEDSRSERKGLTNETLPIRAVERRQGVEVRAGENIFQKLGHLRFFRQRPDDTPQAGAANELFNGFGICSHFRPTKVRCNRVLSVVR